MSARQRSDVQLVTHDNYGTTTTAATKTLPHGVSAVLIENMDSTDNLLVSFDNGATFKTIAPGKALSIDVDNLVSYKIKSSANTPLAQCLYGSEV